MKWIIKTLLRLIIGVFILFNVFCIVHAYKFTHFNKDLAPIYKPPKQIPVEQLVRYIFTGIDIPRPKAKQQPNMPFTHQQIQSDVLLDAWYTYRNKSKGTVILCHGYGNEKSGLNNVAQSFYNKGYNTLQFDFRGNGDSGGDQVTIGFKEAQNVVDAYHFIKKKNPEEPIILYGASMGAVAILKALAEHDIEPVALVMECPFGSMEETVAARFKLFGIPEQPAVPFLVFWGGAINGFNGFSFKPSAYAEKVNTPTLLMIGNKDQFVSKAETQLIFDNLKGPKVLYEFPHALHENYLSHDVNNWNKTVTHFLSTQLK